MASTLEVGMIGLGLMGAALAERLLEHGYRVAVWDRTRVKAGPLLARGAEWSDNPLTTCDRVIISPYTSEVVEAVLAELDAGLHAGRIILDTTTGGRSKRQPSAPNSPPATSSISMRPSLVRASRPVAVRRLLSPAVTASPSMLALICGA